MRGIKLVVPALMAVAAGLYVRPAFAHAFGPRYDLPLPLNYFLIGGALTVALSFVVIGLFVRRQPNGESYPRYNLLNVPVLGAVLRSRVTLWTVQAISVGILGLVVVSSLLGVDRPLQNISPTMVWIIWWVGMGYLAALVGHVWMLINPWKAIFEVYERLTGASDDEEDSAMLSYPENWDVWPALLLFLTFAWMENVYGGASRPFELGVLVVLYSLITLAGMLLFGKHTWLRHGEAFTVLFGFFARFSPTEVRVTDGSLCRECGQGCDQEDGGCVDCYDCFERAAPAQRELNLRPFAVGLTGHRPLSNATAAFVILALATVTFDGLQETPTWVAIQTALYPSVAMFGGYAVKVIDTVGLIVVPALFLGIYLVFAWGIRRLSNERAEVNEVARAFVFSLVPIALAYNMAHYLSLLLIQGQMIIPLASDPLGLGWNLLGTSGYQLNIGIIDTKLTWFISLFAIVLGHIISVYIAHVISLKRVANHRLAVRGQYPMLVLMVFYTATSLWIIAQPIVES